MPKPGPERGILFQPDMVRGLLYRGKRVTRRIITPQPAEYGDNGGRLLDIVPSTLGPGLWDCRYELDNPRTIRCPYGVPGDRLWVWAWRVEFQVLGPTHTEPEEAR